MPTKDPVKNRAYVAKFRQKLINSIGITEYRKRNAEAQKAYRAGKKALKNAHIQDRKLRSLDVNDLINIRKELKQTKSATTIQNAYRNKNAINEFADKFVNKQIQNYLKK